MGVVFIIAHASFQVKGSFGAHLNDLGKNMSCYMKLYRKRLEDPQSGFHRVNILKKVTFLAAESPWSGTIFHFVEK